MKLPPARRPRLKVELLEDRTTPAFVTVTTALDVVSLDADLTSVDALTATPGSDGVISLREAITAAEADSEPDFIDFDVSLLKQPLGLSQFDTGLDDGEVGPSAFQITTPISILGTGQVISRIVEAGDFRLFFVTETGDLELEDLELTGGYAKGGNGIDGGGGAAGMGGAIFNMGTLTLRGTLLDGNAAQGGNGGAPSESAGGGGGLGASAGSQLGGGPNGGDPFGESDEDGGFGGGGAGGSENNAGHGGFGGGGGAGTFGGNGGNGGFGGGGGGSVSNEPGLGGFGGASADEGAGGGGAGLGGAIFNLLGTVNVVNSTITANTAAGGLTGGSTANDRGAGIGAGLFNLNGTVTIVQATLINNIATEDDGSTIPDDLYIKATTTNGGVPDEVGADTFLANSIIGFIVENHFDVANTESTVTFAGRFANAPGGYIEISNGDGNDTTASPEFAAARIMPTDPPVSPTLADNGGLTRTLALTADSEALDVGDNAAAIDPVTGEPIEYDQRCDGFPRISNGTVDLGAFETQVAPPVTPIVEFGKANDLVADENAPSDLLEFTLLRSDDTSSPLTVTLSRSFSLLTSGDYAVTSVTGGTLAADGVTLTFAAGSSAVVVTLTPVNDIQAEADETLTYTVLPQAGIVVGAADTVTLTVVQNDFVVTNANNGGEGTLRQAILNAEAIEGDDTVTFVPSMAGATIALTTFDTGLDFNEAGPSAFNITTKVTIQGTGQTITRDLETGNFRFFTVISDGEGTDGDLTLENLELVGGVARGGNGFSGGGGAAGLGGAIFSTGAVTIRNSTFLGNAAVGGNGATITDFPGGGGGIGQSSTGLSGGGPNGGNFSGGFGGGGGNTESTGGPGGFGGGGGAGGNTNRGGDGGFGGGGGAGVGPPGGAGFGGTPGSASTGGAGGGFGGAVFNYGGTLDIVNSTFTENAARGGTSGDGAASGEGLGGAIFNINGTVTITNSTLAANAADVGGSLYNVAHDFSEGVYNFDDAPATISNSILADSVKPQAPPPGVATPPSDDEVHNVVFTSGTGTGGTFIASIDASSPNITNHGGFVNDGGTMDASGVIAATRPIVVGTLAENGGPTRTLALTPNSEARDVGDNADAVDPVTTDALATDQRGTGFPRITNARVDLGAFEAAQIIDIVVSTQQTSPPPGTPDTVVFTSPNGVVVVNGPQGVPPLGDPFPTFGGGTRVTVGDVNRDGVPDYIFTPGFGGGPQVRVIDETATGAQIYSFFAYEEEFRGGVFVAVGDFNGDGFADIVTGAGLSGAPRVRVFSGKDLFMLADFYAYSPDARGGVAVAAGDVNGDGILDIVTSPGLFEGNEILVVDGTKLNETDSRGQILDGAIYTRFLAVGPEFFGGVVVAAGNLDGDRFADVVAGPLASRSPRLLAFRGSDLTLGADRVVFPPPALDTGLRLAVADADGDGIDEVFAIAGPGGGPHTVVLNPFTGNVIENLFTFDQALRSGFDVG